MTQEVDAVQPTAHTAENDPTRRVHRVEALAFAVCRGGEGQRGSYSRLAQKEDKSKLLPWVQARGTTRSPSCVCWSVCVKGELFLFLTSPMELLSPAILGEA